MSTDNMRERAGELNEIVRLNSMHATAFDQRLNDPNCKNYCGDSYEKEGQCHATKYYGSAFHTVPLGSHGKGKYQGD